MAYCPLVNRFTQGQKERMRAAAIIAPRASLLTSVGCGAVGINDVNSTNELTIFPNPAQNSINVRADTKLLGSAYAVYDYTGELIFKGEITSELTTLEIDNLSGGIYLFSLGAYLKQTFIVTN
jgi:hypothetical protein